jgi:hypothetical protein
MECLNSVAMKSEASNSPYMAALNFERDIAEDG